MEKPELAVTYNGTKLSLSEACRRKGTSPCAVKYQMRTGKTIQEAFDAVIPRSERFARSVLR